MAFQGSVANEAAAALYDLWRRMSKATGMTVTNQTEASLAMDEMEKCSQDYVTLLVGLEDLIKGK